MHETIGASKYISEQFKNRPKNVDLNTLTPSPFRHKNNKDITKWLNCASVLLITRFHDQVGHHFRQKSFSVFFSISTAL